MRYKLTLDVEADGRVIQASWSAHDEEGDRLALGVHVFGSATILPLGQAAELAFVACEGDVLRNGGVQGHLAF